MHLNIRGIPKNIDKLSNYLTLIDLQFSIIALSETWLNNETSEIYELPEYRKGGGVSKEINIMTEHIECLFVEVKSQFKKHKKKILVGVVYRPPNTNINVFTEQIINTIHTLKIENKQCYIMGDFNINLLNCDHHMETHDYVDTMFSNSLIPQITKPTRITPTTATIIDSI